MNSAASQIATQNNTVMIHQQVPKVPAFLSTTGTLFNSLKQLTLNAAPLPAPSM